MSCTIPNVLAFCTTAGRARSLEISRIDQLRCREGISTQTDLTQSRLQFEQAEANRATSARDVAVARARVQLIRDLPINQGGLGAALQPQSQQQPPAPQAPLPAANGRPRQTGRPL